MITAQQALVSIQNRVEEIKNGELQNFPEAASVGDFARQGDLYITKLESIPAGAKSIPFAAQLAPGTSRGSRHCLDNSNVRMYSVANAGPLDGPVIDVKQEVTVTHPEHGDFRLPCGVYKITYQRAFADELRRVRD